MKFGDDFVQKATVTEHFLELLRFLENKFLLKKDRKYENLK
jgi:hypothetical protein